MSTLNYYCYPPVHASSGWDETITPGVWLVTDPNCPSPGPGLYTSWHACAAVTDGMAETPTYYDRQEDSYAAWHVCCRLGEHNHPADPVAWSPFKHRVKVESPAPPTPTKVPQHISPASPSLANLHFAVRGGEVIYSDPESALEHHLRVAGGSAKTEIIATDNYYKAIFFARGAGESAAEQLALARTNNTDPFVATKPGVPCGSITAPISPPPRTPATPRATTSSGARGGRKPIPAPVFAQLSGATSVRNKANHGQSSRARLASTSAGVDESRSKASEKRLAAIKGALEGKGKGKVKSESVEDGGEETDYDVDGEYERLASGWVPVEERFDPSSENKPRDDA
ncbi:hypothetical protein C8F04DRAFT_1189360 [Mycena alexandri]|uniref:Uncharacterized protein n=1 Tax=Mycena alexandri TaxID=1745969 RepID=A0AAD6SGN2_9AGAR|nr:hypothetical protein C8F04DRAFT_1189360 [Mycena alexandri]